MFHRHLRERISRYECLIAELMNEFAKLQLQVDKQEETIKRMKSSLDSTQHYVMSVEERQLFDESGKVKLPYNNGTIALHVGDVIRGILNYIGLEYTPGEPVCGVTFKYREN